MPLPPPCAKGSCAGGEKYPAAVAWANGREKMREMREHRGFLREGQGSARAG